MDNKKPTRRSAFCCRDKRLLGSFGRRSSVSSRGFSGRRFSSRSFGGGSRGFSGRGFCRRFFLLAAGGQGESSDQGGKQGGQFHFLLSLNERS